MGKTQRLATVERISPPNLDSINAVLDLFDTIGSAVMLLNESGEIIWFNATAARFLCVDLQIVNRRLVSSNPEATTNLDRAISRTIRRTDGLLRQAPIAIPRSEGRPIVAYVSRAGRSANDSWLCRGSIVLVDLRGVRLRQREIKAIFNLTSAESRLAAHIARGHSIEEAAASLGISYETSRNQLKRIFQKTGTHRQGELVSLLVRAR